MTSRDKELLVLALSLGIVAASWFGGARLIKAKTAEMTVQKEALQTEYEDRMRILERKDEYLADTKNYNDAFQLMMTQYPGGISTENQILFVTGLEDRFQTQVTSVAYTGEVPIYGFQSLEPDNMAPYELSYGTLQVPLELGYSQFKEFLDYVFTYADKSVMPEVSALFNEESGIVSANVTMYQYAITGNGRTAKENMVNAPIGTDNIFRSGTPLSYGGTAAEQIEAVKKNYSCYVMLHSAASDVKAKVIAGADESEKIISESNEEETLTITAEEQDGRVSLTYALGDGRPHVLYDVEGDTIDIYVYSTKRVGGTDLSGVRAHINNKTAKTMRIAVTGDDTSRPRFVVGEQSGNVMVLK